MSSRTLEREIAFKILYGLDFEDNRDGYAIQRIWKLADPQSFASEISFTKTVVDGVNSHLREIDQLIKDHSHHWKLHRMSVVDRTILRIAVFEIKYCEDVPKLVSINEAVNLAKKYGDKDSHAFVNGILDSIQKASS